MKIEYAVGILIIFLIIYVFLIRFLSKRNEAEDKRSQDFDSIGGDDTAVMATNPKGKKVKVNLPEGVKVQDVKAVYIFGKTAKPKTGVLHEKTDRHNSNGPTDHDMDI